MTMTATAPVRYISGGRELRLYAGYWFVRLTPSEMAEYPGGTWTGYILAHKWKVWKSRGVWYSRDEAMYRFLDGNPDNLRITNIGVKATGTDNWLL